MDTNSSIGTDCGGTGYYAIPMYPNDGLVVGTIWVWIGMESVVLFHLACQCVGHGSQLGAGHRGEGGTT